MNLIKSTNFVVIHGWMLRELHLANSELTAYALIYGFSQDGCSVCSGSLEYIAEWCGVSRRAVIDTLARLMRRGLIHKHTAGYNAYSYSADLTKIHACSDGAETAPSMTQKVHQRSAETSPSMVQEAHQRSEETSPPVVQKLHQRSEETSPNKIEISIENNIVPSIASIASVALSIDEIPPDSAQAVRAESPPVLSLGEKAEELAKPSVQKTDIEAVKMRYLHNYAALFGEDCKPIGFDRWADKIITRPLAETGREALLQALDAAMQDTFCTQERGYLLKVILSDGVLSRLLYKPKQTLKNDIRSNGAFASAGNESFAEMIAILTGGNRERAYAA
jgi:DNA-binding Lrp family transcriptional regulator